MTDTSYYVYALKDPRTSPAMPFYIGKGTGTRSYDHLMRPDNSIKGRRIKEIIASGLLMREGKLAREGNSKRHVAQVS